MGFLTKLLKPALDPNNFEESFSHWECELTRFEKDNRTTLPDQVKVAILLNETSGPLRQHLQLLAGTNQTYTAIRETIAHTQQLRTCREVLQGQWRQTRSA